MPDIQEYKASPGLNIDLENKSICFASNNAKEIMKVATENKHDGFDAWLNFCNKYFEDVTPNVAQRYTQIITDYLK